MSKTRIAADDLATEILLPANGDGQPPKHSGNEAAIKFLTAEKVQLQRQIIDQERKIESVVAEGNQIVDQCRRAIEGTKVRIAQIDEALKGLGE